MNFTFEELRDVSFPWRALLYIVHPAETTPADLESAPDYVAMIVPYFFVLSRDLLVIISYYTLVSK